MKPPTSQTLSQPQKSINTKSHPMQKHLPKTRGFPAPPLRGKAGNPDERRAAAYSPALHRSTIGAGGLSFSVRNGKRRDPAATATLKRGTRQTRAKRQRRRAKAGNTGRNNAPSDERFGQLVALGFGVAAFTPAPYQRRRLRRP